MSALVPPLSFVTLPSFSTESGTTMEKVTISYRRWGALRTEWDSISGVLRTNIVLIEHALTGDSNVMGWWPGIVGPGCAIDTTLWCVICTNALGGCYGSTGPSSIHPDGSAWGSRFPSLSIRDLVRAEHAVIDHLLEPYISAVPGNSGLRWELSAVIGGSLGGARTLEWSAMYPEHVVSAAIFAVSARASAWQIGIQSAQIRSIESDPAWCGGDYYDSGCTPEVGLATARYIAHLTYRGTRELDQRFGLSRQEDKGNQDIFSPRQRFAVDSYLDHQGKSLAARFDAGSYVILTDALNRHDICRGRVDTSTIVDEEDRVIDVLRGIMVPILVVGVDTDVLYPYEQQEFLAYALGNAIDVVQIVSPVGHDAFLVERDQVKNIMSAFMARCSAV